MRMAGPNLDGLQVTGDVVLTPHPGNGIWFESVIADETDTTWYAYYHDECLPSCAGGRIDPFHASAPPSRPTAESPGRTWGSSSRRLTQRGLLIVESLCNRRRRRRQRDGRSRVEGRRICTYSNYGRDPDAQGVLVARFRGPTAMRREDA
jgi:hypothetical protein